MTSYLSEEEIISLGLKRVGNNVLISRNTMIYNPGEMEIGNNVRIDDFCILSGKVKLGNYIHIAAGCFFFAGRFGIEMEDYSTISSRGGIYAVTDDYSGDYMTNPMLPESCRNVQGGKVCIKQHCIIGTGCTILPAVVLDEGVAVGSMSLVNKNLEAWGIYAGIPCRRIKERSRKLLELEW